MFFRFPRTSLESFLHLWIVLQYVYFPLVHFYELVVNFNLYEPGLIKVQSSKSFIVTQQIHIQVKQEDEKRHIIHNSAKVYQAM